MKKSTAFLTAGVLATVVVAALLIFRPHASSPAADGSWAASPALAGDSRSLSLTAPPPAAIDVPLPGSEPDDAADAADGDPGVIAFRVDKNGRVVTNERARLNIEKLYALYSPAEREQKLAELGKTLPATATAELAALVEQYTNYQEAAYQNYPPGREMVSVEEELRELDGMHALRAQYFGEQVANGFFSQEEKIQRELYKLMSVEQDQSLTLEEKAERAQELYNKSMPAVAAAERAGKREAERDAAAAAQH